jgi:hypothetical protein
MDRIDWSELAAGERVGMEGFILFIRFDAVGVDGCCFGDENHHVYGSKKNVAVYTRGELIHWILRVSHRDL